MWQRRAAGLIRTVVATPPRDACCRSWLGKGEVAHLRGAEMGHSDSAGLDHSALLLEPVVAELSSAWP